MEPLSLTSRGVILIMMSHLQEVTTSSIISYLCFLIQLFINNHRDIIIQAECISC